jgi:hypothetical protein
VVNSFRFELMSPLCIWFSLHYRDHRSPTSYPALFVRLIQISLLISSCSHLFARSPSNQPPLPGNNPQMNINAGSDTATSTLHAIFYCFLMYPSTRYPPCGAEYHQLFNVSLPLPTWSDPVPLHYHRRRPPHAPRLGLNLERRTCLRFEARRRTPPAWRDRRRESLGQGP